MRRREFVTLLGGAVAAWPLAARAQERERVRRVGAMAQLDWLIGRNVLVDTRWATANAEAIRRQAAELVALAPDVIFSPGASTVGPLLRATRRVPIVFAIVGDPVGAGFVENLARPGGNATGFMAFEYSIGGKWLELLKEIAPALTRVAVLRDPTTTSGAALFGVIQAMAPSLRVEVNHVNVRDAADIERGITHFAQSSNGGLIVPGDPPTNTNRSLIVKLAAQHRLPTVYHFREFVDAGGLMSYGAHLIEQFRQSARYVDRILKGEKPANLPVQAPTKYELVINLKTAKALGLEVPPTLLARTDEVIE
jgi:putative tryptophan/tyrosine transport system substrate-binding protein